MTPENLHLKFYSSPLNDCSLGQVPYILSLSLTSLSVKWEQCVNEALLGKQLEKMHLQHLA